MGQECQGFRSRSIPGGPGGPAGSIFKVQTPKFQESMFFGTCGTSVIGIKYEYVEYGLRIFFQGSRCPISTNYIPFESS